MSKFNRPVLSLGSLPARVVLAPPPPPLEIKAVLNGLQEGNFLSSAVFVRELPYTHKSCFKSCYCRPSERLVFDVFVLWVSKAQAYGETVFAKRVCTEGSGFYVPPLTLG